jgi:hypothetical protein
VVTYTVLLRLYAQEENDQMAVPWIQGVGGRVVFLFWVEYFPQVNVMLEVARVQ